MDTILESVQGNIKIVQYNKPKRKNAIDKEMYVRVTQIMHEVARDANIAVMVLTGTGDYYSSGNDLRAEAQSSDLYKFKVLKAYIEAFIMFPKLLIAVVNGPAVGVAATTLGLCDLVFAADHSFFWTPFTKLGIVAEGCSTFTFPQIMGPRKTTEMLIMNYRMSAAEALQCGLVNYVYKPEDVQSQVWDKIQEVSKLPQHSVLTTRTLIRCQIQDQLLRTNEEEIQALERIWGSAYYYKNGAKEINEKSKI